MIFLFIVCFMNVITVKSQEAEPPATPNATVTIDTKEAKSVRKAVEKEEKKNKKADKKAKKEEKERKKEEQLAKAISNKRKAVKKNEARIVKLENKLVKDEARGKLSPVDKAKSKTKIQQLNTTVAKDKEKLNKLVKKQ